MSYGDPGSQNKVSGEIFISDRSQESLGQLNMVMKGANSYTRDAELAELYSHICSQEEEILRLRKRIADACNKELELINEKHVLEMKLSDLRMALDEKQNNALAEGLKDLTTRKAYVEENLKLADELKVLEDETYIYTSSLLNLLAEYGVRPSVIDASSISNNTKRLYTQMQWRIRSLHIDDQSQHPHDMHAESSSNQNGVESRDIERQAIRHHSNASLGSEGECKPGIEGFIIYGDAKPGNTLNAYGYPINGTSVCYFQWVRYLQDGTKEYVEGARNPEYFVTADDVDKFVAVECVPLDSSHRQGDLVTYFANNHNKIACDPEMQQQIQKYISTGRASFNVSLLSDSSENWEPATLVLKRSSFQIKINHVDTLPKEEKYSDDLSIKLPFGLSVQFLLTCSDRTSYLFSTSGTSNEIITENDLWLRDIIVLTMRLFQTKALDDKKKGKL